MSCGGGNRTRSRNCTNPPPTRGGSFCKQYSNSSNMQISNCQSQTCPGKFLEICSSLYFFCYTFSSVVDMCSFSRTSFFQISGYITCDKAFLVVQRKNKIRKKDSFQPVNFSGFLKFCLHNHSLDFLSVRK